MNRLEIRNSTRSSTFEEFWRQLVDEFEKGVEIDVLGFVPTILLKGDVAIGGRAGFVVQSRIFGHLRPVLVVQLLHRSSTFPLVSEVKEGFLQIFVAGHRDYPFFPDR